MCIGIMAWLIYCLVKSLEDDDIDDYPRLTWNSHVRVDDSDSETSELVSGGAIPGSRRILSKRILSGSYGVEADGLCAGSSGGESEHDPSLVDSVGPASLPGCDLQNGGSLPMAASPEVSLWKTADVSNWLANLELPQHSAAFKAAAIDGTMLLTLSDDDLHTELGVSSALHRKKIMIAVSELRA